MATIPVKTERTDKYYDLLLQLNTTSDAALFENAMKLVESFDKGELDYCITSTLWAWNGGNKEHYYKLFEALLNRDADYNSDPSAFDGPIPAYFRAVKFNDPPLIDLFVKAGADINRKIHLYSRPLTSQFSMLDYIIYWCALEGKRLPKHSIKHLINLGVSVNLEELQYIFGRTEGKTREIYKRAKNLIKITRLEAELKAARDYILELEYRPPELGGPEYEAGLKRWEARQN